MLSIEFFGQACTAVRCHRTGVEIVSDPWFSDTAHVDSWHAYPEWTPDEQDAIRRRLDSTTHIYLSHNHADHFDPEFLRSLKRKKIIVGDFQNTRFREQLHNLSEHHDIQYVRHGEIVALNDEVKIQIFLQQPAFRIDSVMLLKAPDAVVLNANDCGLDSAILKAIGRKSPPTIFLFTLNYMASGYPISYLFSRDPIFNARMDAVRNEVVNTFRVAVERLKPKMSVAFAGPVTFGDDINSHLNLHPESCNWEAMIAELREIGPVVWPAPFSRMECIDGAITGSKLINWGHYRSRPVNPSPPPAISHYTEAELLKCAEEFAADLADVLHRMQQSVSTSLVLSGVRSLERIESSETDWSIEINFDHQSVRSLGSKLPRPPYLRIIAPSTILYEFLKHEINVDELLLSARGRFMRDPDTFNQVLHNLLRYGGDPLSSHALVNWYLRRARCNQAFEVHVDGQKCRIPKMCPHEGENLELAPIENGVLVCPRHRWRYDLATGQCIEGDRSVNLYTLAEQIND